MSRGAAFVAVLGLLLALGWPAAVDVRPAEAASCMSQGQARAAVQSGQAIQLSGVLAQIRAAVPGQIVSEPLLCDTGGRLVYMVDVLNQGVVTHVQIDAHTGSISY